MTADVRLLSISEVARLYRLRRATVSAAYRSGQIKGRERGKGIYLSAKRAEVLWGAA